MATVVKPTLALDSFEVGKLHEFLGELEALSYVIEHPITVQAGKAIATVHYSSHHEEYLISEICPKQT